MAEPLTSIGGLTPTFQAFAQAAMDGALQGLPEFQRGKLAEALAKPSPVDGIVMAMEALYAAKTDLSSDQNMLMFQAASCVAEHHFYGKTERALAIMGAARRKAREKDAPPADADPDPEIDFIKPEPQEPA